MIQYCRSWSVVKAWNVLVTIIILNNSSSVHTQLNSTPARRWERIPSMAVRSMFTITDGHDYEVSAPNCFNVEVHVDVMSYIDP